MMQRQPRILDYVAGFLSMVLASVVVAALPPQASDAVEFLIWMVFFGASWWLLDWAVVRRIRRPPRA
jgi:hypothetical protein